MQILVSNKPNRRRTKTTKWEASTAKPRKPPNMEDASRSRTHPEGGIVVFLLMCHYYGWWGAVEVGGGMRGGVSF